MKQTQTTQETWSASLKLCVEANLARETQSSNHVLSTVKEIITGRDSECDIPIDSIKYPSVSRHHAKIQPIKSNLEIYWQICDLNSANGTYINGKRLEDPYSLQDGDRISLGRDGPEFIFECRVINNIASTSQGSESPDICTTASVVSTSSSSLPPALPSAPVIQDILAPTPAPRDLWRLISDTAICTLVGHSDLVRSLAFSSDGKILASGSADKTIKLWNLSKGEEVQTISAHKMAVNAVAFSPDGQTLVSGGADKTIKVWNLKTKEESQTLTGHGMGVNALAFSPDGRLLASGSADKTVKLWNLSTGEAIHTLSSHKMAVNAVAFTLDGKILASGGLDRTIKLWNPGTGEEIITLPSFRSSINTLMFSPDGEKLAIAHEDKTIRLWDLKTNQELLILPGQVGQAGGIAISPNGQQFASGREDMTIQVWSL